MTVTSLLTEVTAEGNDLATSFSFSPVVIFAATDLVVTHVDADEVETVLSQGSGATNYSVTVSSFPGTGSITYPADEVTPLPTGESLVIRRVLPLTQATNLTNQGPYLPKVQENQFDRLVMIAQQLKADIDRAFLVPVGSSIDTGDLITSLLAAEVSAEADAATATAAATTATEAAEDARAAVDTKTAAHTLVLADAGNYIRMNGGAADNNVTVPPNSTVAFPTDTEVHIEQTSANQVTVVAGSGVTINTSETLKLSKQYAVATLKKVATDTWTLFGYLEAAP